MNKNKYFKWSYDEEHDILHIKFLRGGDFDVSEHLESCGVVLDFDKKNKCVGVEIFDYKKGWKKYES